MIRKRGDGIAVEAAPKRPILLHRKPSVRQPIGVGIELDRIGNPRHPRTRHPASSPSWAMFTGEAVNKPSLGLELFGFRQGRSDADLIGREKQGGFELSHKSRFGFAGRFTPPNTLVILHPRIKDKRFIPSHHKPNKEKEIAPEQRQEQVAGMDTIQPPTVPESQEMQSVANQPKQGDTRVALAVT
jgi:hypothetical protein